VLGDPGVQAVGRDRGLSAGKGARGRGDHLEPRRFVVAPTQLTELGVEPRRIDERDAAGAQRAQPLHRGGARRHQRDPARASLQPSDHVGLGALADHVGDLLVAALLPS
jgi:hypothetical protein